jgi:hypothetical protein
MNESWIQAIAIIGSNLVIMLTFFGVSVSLHLSTREDIRAMQQDSKDFHIKLALQDLEFKNRICSIEERNKYKK